jgi:hypothetical protein
VPLLGALAVWLTYRLGLKLGDGYAAAFDALVPAAPRPRATAFAARVFFYQLWPPPDDRARVLPLFRKPQ